MVTVVIIERPGSAVSISSSGIVYNAAGCYIITPVGAFTCIEAHILVCLVVFVTHLESWAVYGNRLNGGSRLTRINCSVVELLACSAAAAHHALDFSGLQFHYYCGCLRLTNLLLQSVEVAAYLVAFVCFLEEVRIVAEELSRYYTVIVVIE